MFYFGLFMLLAFGFSTVISGFCVICTKITMGQARSSALVWYGYSQLTSTALASAVQLRYDGTHLLGSLLAIGALWTVWVREQNRRWA